MRAKKDRAPGRLDDRPLAIPRDLPVRRCWPTAGWRLWAKEKMRATRRIRQELEAARAKQMTKAERDFEAKAPKVAREATPLEASERMLLVGLIIAEALR